MSPSFVIVLKEYLIKKNLVKSKASIIGCQSRLLFSQSFRQCLKEEVVGAPQRALELSQWGQSKVFLERNSKNLFISSCTLFWNVILDDITKFWDENLLLFTFLTGKLRKNLFWTNKNFVYLNIITHFHPKITSGNIVWTT